MPVMKVYYQKSDFAHFGLREFEVSANRKDELRVRDMPNTHTLVREMDFVSKDAVYRRMQADQWTDDEKNAGLPSDVSHMSMSAGDIYQNENGVYFECLLTGWRIMT